MQATVLSQSNQANDKQLIQALAHSKIYRQYERTFTEATGLPLTLRPVEFFGLPFHGKKNENQFCAFLADDKSTCHLCLQSQGHCSSNAGAGPYNFRCPFGFIETTVPVRVGDRVIGFLATGQIFTHQPDVEKFKKAAARLFPRGSALARKAERLWKQAPVINPAKYQAIVELLNFFAKQLSELSNQIVLEQANTEPLVISKARKYIAANKGEALSLTRVAQAAGASVFYFCKLFRKATGLKFTDYLARVRLEDACTRLRNPNLRISEIAHDVGFQSLTQFNRTFQRVFGQSPTEYRAGLSHLSA